MTRDAVETGLLIAKRRHQLNRAGGVRQPGEPRMRQADLAALLDVAASTVANWERGKSFPERHLGDVEQVLGISLTENGRVPQPPADPRERKLYDLLLAGIEDMTPAEALAIIEEQRRARRRTA